VWGPASISCGRWLSKNLTGISLSANANIPTDIQVHFVGEFDAHARSTGARGIGELCATSVAAAVANAVYDAVGTRIRDLPITPVQGHVFDHALAKRAAGWMRRGDGHRMLLSS
jgi:hypothetical protein